MKVELDSFSKDAQAIVDTFLKGLDETPAPPILYHYTSEAGLKGILDSGKLWLTDIFSLNDPSEMTYGFSRALPILNEFVANLHPAGKKFTDNITVFARSGLMRKVAHLFVCSFSSQGDDLGQWRAYADNAKGYVLAFDGKLLEDAFLHENNDSFRLNRSTFHIRYEDTKLREVHTEIVKRMAPLILLPEGRRDLQDGAINAYMQELTVLTLLYLLQVVLSFKHPSYIHEGEFRFLESHRMDQPPEAKIRIRLGTEVRYREFDWRSTAPEALLEICIGPAGDVEKANLFVKDILNPTPGLNPRITRSEIPYRAL